VINCYSGEATGKERPIGKQEVGFGPDGALEEGEEDVRNGLNGAEGEGVATTVHSRVEGEGAGLALREVGWADTSSGSRFQQMVASVSAGAKAQAINVEAGDLDGDDALQHQVQRDWF